MRKPRVLFLITALCLLLCSAGTAERAVGAVFSDGDFSYELQPDQTLLILSYTGTETNLVLPEAVEGYPVVGLKNTTGSDGSVHLALADCPVTLNTVTLPAGFTQFNMLNYAPAAGSLTRILLSEDNTAFQLKDGVLFTADGSTLVCFPGGLTDKSGKPVLTYEVPEGTTVIDPLAFCRSGLSRLTLPDSLITIRNGAFSDMPALKKLVIPEGVTSIGNLAFYGSGPKGRLAVYLPASAETFGQSLFSAKGVPYVREDSPAAEYVKDSRSGASAFHTYTDADLQASIAEDIRAISVENLPKGSYYAVMSGAEGDQGLFAYDIPLQGEAWGNVMFAFFTDYLDSFSGKEDPYWALFNNLVSNTGKLQLKNTPAIDSTKYKAYEYACRYTLNDGDMHIIIMKPGEKYTSGAPFVYICQKTTLTDDEKSAGSYFEGYADRKVKELNSFLNQPKLVYQILKLLDAGKKDPDLADWMERYRTMGSYGLVLNETELVLGKGSIIQLTPSMTGVDKDKRFSVTWSTSSRKIAYVFHGRVTAKMGGTATVTATVTTEDGSVFSASCVITVIEPIASIQVEGPTNATGIIGESYQMKALIRPKYATFKDVTWASSDESVATVDQTGLVTCIGPGQAVITVTPDHEPEKHGKVIFTNPAIPPVKNMDYTISEPGPYEIAIPCYSTDPEKICFNILNKQCISLEYRVENEQLIMTITPLKAGKPAIDITDENSKSSRVRLRLRVEESAVQ